jgi:hypothetical protein
MMVMMLAPRSSPLRGDVKYVFTTDPSIQRSLRVASYDPPGEIKVFLTPIEQNSESNACNRGPNLENNWT